MPEIYMTLYEKEGVDKEDDCDEQTGNDSEYTVTNPFFVPRLHELIYRAANANSNIDTTLDP
jgi:hypothetical protein